VADIRRGDHAGQQVHAAAGFRRLFDAELVGDGLHRAVEAVHVRAGVAGRGHVHDVGQGQVAELGAELGQNARHVVADCLRKAGGGHADDLGAVLLHGV